MCFFCCYFCCPEDIDEFEVEQRAHREAKLASLPKNADRKVITFIEQVRTKGVTAYERYAQQYQNKCHQKRPLLRDRFGKPVCSSRKYLTCHRPSGSLSDVSEKSEDSSSETSVDCTAGGSNNHASLTYSHSGSFTCSINGDDISDQARIMRSTDAKQTSK